MENKEDNRREAKQTEKGKGQGTVTGEYGDRGRLGKERESATRVKAPERGRTSNRVLSSVRSTERERDGISTQSASALVKHGANEP
jgi:hypothetical protein